MSRNADKSSENGKASSENGTFAAALLRSMRIISHLGKKMGKKEKICRLI